MLDIIYQSLLNRTHVFGSLNSLQPMMLENETEKAPPKVGKSGKKICCSCPETRILRDECAVLNGPENCKVSWKLVTFSHCIYFILNAYVL